MEMNALRVLPISETTQVGDARRAGLGLAERLGFDDTDAGRVAIVLTEMANNLVKHAQGGEMLMQPVAVGMENGFETLAIDRGPGLARLGEMMGDGFSTSGTSGTGLGAIFRQSTTFDVYTQPGRGTVFYSGIWPGQRKPAAIQLPHGAVCVPMPGETICGDDWAMIERNGLPLVLVADGLGHGPLARTAATRAAEIFRDHSGGSPGELVQRMHDALRPTRGAAAAVAQLDRAQGRLTFCGIGNISASVLTNGSVKHLVSHHGTLGHDLHKIQEFEYPWSDDATLVMHSDGLKSHWKMEDYPGLLAHHPTLVAGLLYRDHMRGRDDATVVVVRGSA